MANKDTRPTADTGEYSATKAPENREHLESRTGTSDASQTPGGHQGAPVEVGVSALDRKKVRTPLRAARVDPMTALRNE